ncbi:hypothetical protein FB45DRAFT_1050479 [Roridomyces roridus]|uniref:Uncharacterized protein n=1 Tax=Roridomyces roridus TaxID=1738132 RepID=A0AAD7CK01_9AGAR|nr:hypothetical protein FB45DRAFT_1050479 [Roridomyces roridus]
MRRSVQTATEDIQGSNSSKSDKLRRLHALTEEAGDVDMNDWEELGTVNIHAILQGEERIELSHAGGELQAELEWQLEEEFEVNSKKRKYPDFQMRRDRIEIRTEEFEIQMPEMLLAYLRWFTWQTDPDPSPPVSEEPYKITVVDMFECCEKTVILDPRGGTIAASLIMAGLMPSAPLQPTVAVTVRVLEAYRIMHCRCPQLAILSFVKSFCDIHQVEFQSYLTQQFSIAYDLYLDILRRCDRRGLDVLGRDSPSWCMKNACPACMYELEGEDDLIFRILTAMDGNDSLKHILRRDKDDRSKSSGSVGKGQGCADAPNGSQRGV